MSTRRCTTCMNVFVPTLTAPTECPDCQRRAQRRREDRETEERKQAEDSTSGFTMPDFSNSSYDPPSIPDTSSDSSSGGDFGGGGGFDGGGSSDSI